MPSILVEMSAEFDDGSTLEVVADQRDISRWEIQDFGCPFADIDSRAHMALRWLAWHAAKRQQKTGVTWEKWDAACVQVSSADQGDEADPTVPAGGGGPSPGTTAVSAATSSTSRRRPGSR